MKKTEKYICIEDHEDLFGNLYQKGDIKEVQVDYPTIGAGAFVIAANYQLKLIYTVPEAYWKKIPPSKLEQALEGLVLNEEAD